MKKYLFLLFSCFLFAAHAQKLELNIRHGEVIRYHNNLFAFGKCEENDTMKYVIYKLDADLSIKSKFQCPIDKHDKIEWLTDDLDAIFLSIINKNGGIRNISLDSNLNVSKSTTKPSQNDRKNDVVVEHRNLNLVNYSPKSEIVELDSIHKESTIVVDTARKMEAIQKTTHEDSFKKAYFVFANIERRYEPNLKILKHAVDTNDAVVMHRNLNNINYSQPKISFDSLNKVVTYNTINTDTIKNKPLSTGAKVAIVAVDVASTLVLGTPILDFNNDPSPPSHKIDKKAGDFLSVNAVDEDGHTLFKKNYEVFGAAINNVQTFTLDSEVVVFGNIGKYNWFDQNYKNKGVFFLVLGKDGHEKSLQKLPYDSINNFYFHFYRQGYIYIDKLKAVDGKYRMLVGLGKRVLYTPRTGGHYAHDFSFSNGGYMDYYDTGYPTGPSYYVCRKLSHQFLQMDSSFHVISRSNSIPYGDNKYANFDIKEDLVSDDFQNALFFFRRPTNINDLDNAYYLKVRENRISKKYFRYSHGDFDFTNWDDYIIRSVDSYYEIGHIGKSTIIGIRKI